MKPLDIKETEGARRAVFAEGQDEYQDLPALVFPEGSVLTRWKPSEDERRALVAGAAVELWVWPFGRPLQPVALQVQGVDGD